MDFLRRQLFWIACGLAAAAGIALGVTGIQAMPGVVEEMRAAEAVYRNLDPIFSKPLNRKAIDNEERRIRIVEEDFQKILKRAKELYRYQPLVPDVLPDGPPLKRVEFRKAYHEAMDRLFESLRSGGVPSEADIANMKDRRENERLQRGRTGAASFGSESGGDARSLAGVLTEQGVRDDPLSRASIAKALSIFCYAVPWREAKSNEPVATLQFSEYLKDLTRVDPPLSTDVWFAQLGYWIQKDVLDAIVATNEAGAAEAKKAGQQPWVGNMPIKDVISIRLSGFVPPEGGLVVVAKPGGYGEALPPGTGETVFTDTKQSDTFEVIQFTVKLVMDQRDIPMFVERLCNNSFHTLVRASYVAVPPNRDLKGKIYGPEPVVNVVFDFETVLLGEVFRPLMPLEVCETYEIACPERG